MNRTLWLKILVLAALTSGLVAVFAALFRFHLEVRRLLAFKSNTNWTIEDMFSTTFNPIRYNENTITSNVTFNMSSTTPTNLNYLEDEGETTTEFLNLESEDAGSEFIAATLVPDELESETIPTTTMGGPITRESRASKSQPEYIKNDEPGKVLDDRPVSRKPKSRRLTPTRAISPANLAIDESILIAKENVIKLENFPQTISQRSAVTVIDAKLPVKPEVKVSLPQTALQGRRAKTTKSNVELDEEVVTNKDGNFTTNNTPKSANREKILAMSTASKRRPRIRTRLDPVNRIRGRKRKVQQSIEETESTGALNGTVIPLPTPNSEFVAMEVQNSKDEDVSANILKKNPEVTTQFELEDEGDTTEPGVAQFNPLEESESQERAPVTVDTEISISDMTHGQSNIFSSDEEDTTTETDAEQVFSQKQSNVNQQDSSAAAADTPILPEVEKSQIVTKTTPEIGANGQAVEPTEQKLGIPTHPVNQENGQVLEPPVLSDDAKKSSKPEVEIATLIDSSPPELSTRTSQEDSGSPNLDKNIPELPSLPGTKDQLKSDSSLPHVKPLTNIPIIPYYTYGSFETGLSSGSDHGNLLDPRFSTPQPQIVYLFPNLQFQQYVSTTPGPLLSIQSPALAQSQFLGSTAFVQNELSSPPVPPPKSIYHYQGKNNFYWGVENVDGTTSEQRGSIKFNTGDGNGRFVTELLEGLYSYHGMDGKIYATSYTSDSSAYRPMNV